MYPVDCPICLSKGFVMIRKKTHEYKYRCRCRHGDAHKYEGQDCSKHKTNYYCASVDELPAGTIETLIAENCKRYGIKKVADRWMKPAEHNLTQDQVKEMKVLAWDMMKVSI